MVNTQNEVSTMNRNLQARKYTYKVFSIATAHPCYGWNIAHLSFVFRMWTNQLVGRLVLRQITLSFLSSFFFLHVFVLAAMNILRLTNNQSQYEFSKCKVFFHFRNNFTVHLLSMASIGGWCWCCRCHCCAVVHICAVFALEYHVWHL